MRLRTGRTDPIAEVMVRVLIEIDDVVVCIENLRHDQRLIVDVALVEIDEERCFVFADRAAEVSAVLARLNWRAGVSKRVTRIERVVVEIKRNLPAKTIAAGLRKNLDATQAEAIVLR